MFFLLCLPRSASYYLEVCSRVSLRVATKYYFNTLSANYEYSRSNKENLPLPIQLQLKFKCSSNVNESQKLLRSSEKYFYPTFSSF